MGAGAVTRETWWLLGAALALHLALYAPSLPNAFTFDDGKIVLQEPEVNGRAPLLTGFLRPYFPVRKDTCGIAYRPVTILSLGLDVRLFGPSPAAMRLENILWAGLGAGLFAWLARLAGAPPAAAAAVVVLLSCHPVRSEAVVSIVGRSELLAFAFVTLALVLALGSLEVPRAGFLAFLSAFALLLGLLSKENAFAAPALLGALLVVAPRPAGRQPVVRLALSWGLAFGVAFGLRRLVLGGFLVGPEAAIDPADNPLASMAASGRVRAAIALLPRAAIQELWPRTLAADYGSNSFPRSDLVAVTPFLAGLALLVCAGALALLLWRRAPLVSLGLLWAGATYLPFANVLFATGTNFAERLLYAPAAGVVLAIAALCGLGPRSRAKGVALVTVLGAAALLGAWRIESRIPEWRDDRTLFSAVVRDLPGNGRAWFNLALFSLSEGNGAAARRELSAALRNAPELQPRVEALASHAARLGRGEMADAIRGALSDASKSR